MLVKPEKHEYKVLRPETRNRTRFNKKVLDIVTQFTGTIDISLRKTAGEGPFAFPRDLIQVGGSVPCRADQITNIDDLFDWLSEKIVRVAVIEQAD
jgi:hypothetical protein